MAVPQATFQILVESADDFARLMDQAHDLSRGAGYADDFARLLAGKYQPGAAAQRVAAVQATVTASQGVAAGSRIARALSLAARFGGAVAARSLYVIPAPNGNPREPDDDDWEWRCIPTGALDKGFMHEKGLARALKLWSRQSTIELSWHLRTLNSNPAAQFQPYPGGTQAVLDIWRDTVNRIDQEAEKTLNRNMNPKRTRDGVNTT